MKLFAALVIALAVAVLPSFAAAEFAAGAPLVPQTLKWRTQTIRISVSSSLLQPNSGIKLGSDVSGALERALARWSAATGLKFVVESSERQSVSASGVAGDGVSLITIAQTPENLQLFSKDPFAESARTRVFYNRRGGITEADIVLNPFQQFSTDGSFGTFDLETTLTHELGHLLGLRHSSDLGSMMSERTGSNGAVALMPRDLGLSDLAAIHALYAFDSEDCCSVVKGRVSYEPRATGNVSIWAEDKLGRVAGVVEAGSDGSYSLGGLGSNGEYRLFWTRQDGATNSSGLLGVPNVEGELSKRIGSKRGEIGQIFLGTGSETGDTALRLKAGDQYIISVAAKGWKGNLAIRFSSGSLAVDPASVTRVIQDGDTGLYSFIVSVDQNTPAGSYSLTIERPDGARASVIGAAVVMPSVDLAPSEL
jgi:hypothetical protein